MLDRLETAPYSARLLAALVASWSIPSVVFPAAFAAYLKTRDAYVPGFSIMSRDGTHIQSFGYQLVWPAFGLANLLVFLPISLAVYFVTRRRPFRVRVSCLLLASILWCLVVIVWFARQAAV